MSSGDLPSGRQRAQALWWLPGRTRQYLFPKTLDASRMSALYRLLPLLETLPAVGLYLPWWAPWHWEAQGQPQASSGVLGAACPAEARAVASVYLEAKREGSFGPTVTPRGIGASNHAMPPPQTLGAELSEVCLADIRRGSLCVWGLLTPLGRTWAWTSPRTEVQSRTGQPGD